MLTENTQVVSEAPGVEIEALTAQNQLVLVIREGHTFLIHDVIYLSKRSLDSLMLTS